METNTPKIKAISGDKSYIGASSSYCFDDFDECPLVISVSTDLSSGCLNLIMTLERLKYDYSIIGLNEKWKSWPWRTRMYISALMALKEGNLNRGITPTDLKGYMNLLPAINTDELVDTYMWRDDISYSSPEEVVINNDKSSFGIYTTERTKEKIVILVDAGDLLFLKSPKELVSSFLSYNAPVVIGAENGCCSGAYYPKHLINRRTIMSDYKKIYPNSPLRFPNGGCVMGYESAVMDLLLANINIADDQNGYLELKLQNTKWFELDIEARIVANIKYASIFDPPSESECSEEDLWNIDMKCKPSPEYPWSIRVMSKYNDSFPCIVHFPGGNWDAYNKFCSSLLGEISQPIAAKGTMIKYTVSKAWHKSWVKPLQYLVPGGGGSKK